MNRSDWLTDELIEAAFERRAGRAAPDDLRDGILSQTAVTGQRRAWAVRLSERVVDADPRPAWVAIAVLVALLGLAIALALVGQRPTTPFRTGLLAYVSGGDVYVAQPDGSGAEVALHQDGVAFQTVAWSPVGSRLADRRGVGRVMLDPAPAPRPSSAGPTRTGRPMVDELGGRGTVDREPGGRGRSSFASWTRRPVRRYRTYPFPAIGGLDMVAEWPLDRRKRRKAAREQRPCPDRRRDRRGRPARRPIRAARRSPGSGLVARLRADLLHPVGRPGWLQAVMCCDGRVRRECRWLTGRPTQCSYPAKPISRAGRPTGSGSRFAGRCPQRLIGDHGHRDRDHTSRRNRRANDRGRCGRSVRMEP